MKRIHNHEGIPPTLVTGHTDTYVKLAKNRILFVSEPVTNQMATELSAMLLYFDNEDHDTPIQMYIHSPGGVVTGLTNIYDVMQIIHAPIKTVCMGACYSAAAVLLAAGTKGERYAFKNASIMIHGIQLNFPIPGYDMTTSQVYYDFVSNHNDLLMKMLSHHTGHSLEKIREDCKQDLWMDAKKALDYGIIDHIIS